MARLLISLVEISESLTARVLGRSAAPDLVELVRRRILHAQKEDLARLESPGRLVPDQVDE